MHLMLIKQLTNVARIKKMPVERKGKELATNVSVTVIVYSRQSWHIKRLDFRGTYVS